MRGFTLIEILVVLVIIAILAALLFPALTKLRERSEKVTCLANMKSLHVSFSAYMQDKGHWPQLPPELSAQAKEQWWIDALTPFSAPPKVWICPSFRRLYSDDPSKYSSYPKIHYIPTRFDDKPLTPSKWPTMPWLIEIGDFHGGGNILIYPDGHTRQMDDVLAEAQKAK